MQSTIVLYMAVFRFIFREQCNNFDVIVYDFSNKENISVLYFNVWPPNTLQKSSYPPILQLCNLVLPFDFQFPKMCPLFKFEQDEKNNRACK